MPFHNSGIRDLHAKYTSNDLDMICLHCGYRKGLHYQNNQCPGAVDIIFPKMKKLKDEEKCPICKEIIGEFKDELSKKEFRISGLCQKCQDETFG